MATLHIIVENKGKRVYVMHQCISAICFSAANKILTGENLELTTYTMA
jgi:hypothetical protein